jgi:hypothetical protein
VVEVLNHASGGGVRKERDFFAAGFKGKVGLAIGTARERLRTLVRRSMMTPENTQDPSPSAKPGESAPPAELGETAYADSDTPASTPRPASSSGTAQGWTGKALGKYQVTGVLGQGGMGVVLKAYDPMIGVPYFCRKRQSCYFFGAATVHFAPYYLGLEVAH